jgi:predicted ester cyclase
MRIEAIIAEGDTVAVRVFAEGTNLGPLNGIVPPTGKRFAARQSHWFRVADGKLAEHWATREDLPVMLAAGRRAASRRAAVLAWLGGQVDRAVVRSRP